jgi:hypothetical protein
MKKLCLLLVLSLLPMLATAQEDAPPPPDSLTLTPAEYNFGTSARDFRYYETFKVENDRSNTITITGISTQPNPPFSIVRQQTTCGNLLLPGQKCYIQVELYAGTDGSKNGVLTVDCTGAGACPLTASLSATVVSDATLTVTSGSCDLVALVGGEASCTVQLTNNLPTNLQINDISAEPDPPFSETNGCPGMLGSNHSCSITVTCQPLEEGLVEGSLTVTDNAPDGGPPALSVSCYGLPHHICQPGSCPPPE